MFRHLVLVILGVLTLGSLNGNVSSQTLYTTPSSHVSNNTANIHRIIADDFVPDSLTADDDDAEDASLKTVRPEINEHVNKVVPSKDLTNKVSGVRPSRTDYQNKRQRDLLQDTRRSLDITSSAPSSQNNRLSTQDLDVRGTTNVQPSQGSFLRSLAPPNDASKVSSSDQDSAVGQAGEEEKLRVTTLKLAKRLRNRLRRKLEEVARLEERCDVEKKLLTRLNETIKAEASERQAEIKAKLQTQNQLKVIRRHFHEPDRELKEVRAENSHLVDQLAHLRKTYDDLAAVRKRMEDRLVSAGFTHWLEKRGQEYLPATAVGVLSKSVRILDPFSRGLEEVAKLDSVFSAGVGSVVPISQRSIASKIVRDLALLAPVLPIVMFLWRISQMSHCLSVLHLIMYISVIFAVESTMMFVLSLCIGAEATTEIQASHDLLFVTGVFVDALLYSILIFLQVLVTALRTSRSEIIQSVLSLTVGYHFFRTVFKPAVLSQPPTTTIVAHSMYALNFFLISLEKKATLRVGTRFDNHLNTCLLASERWISETVQAMKDLFADTAPHISDHDTINTDVHSLSNQNVSFREAETYAESSQRKETHVEEADIPSNEKKVYGRWTGGRTGHRTSQNRNGFRGIGWYGGREKPEITLSHSRSRRRASRESKGSETDAPDVMQSRKE